MATLDIIILACLLAGIAAALTAIRRRPQQSPTAPEASHAPAVFLFQNNNLRDVSPSADRLLPPGATDLRTVEAFLTTGFPDLSLGTVGPAEITLEGRLPGTSLKARADGDSLRVAVWGLDRIASERTASDLALLRDVAAHAPQLIWQQLACGRVIWSNAAFRQALDDVQPDGGVLFPDLDGATAANGLRRQPAGCDLRWFDISSVPRDGVLTCFATETTELVRADANRREYVKTLGRTFGDLSTGLAIFDKDRQLKMFNPALLEMSKLPFAFLSARPRIDTVLDRMRELQMMPEPKDYISWREQFTAVEAGAKRGTYCENWPLPDGQTFRVTGRPHPDGAFALLFEDITAEISLTRRFRSEIETGQAVLDSLPDALAVFSRTGTLVMTNAAYTELWGGGGQHFTHRDVSSEIAHWRENSVTSAVWAEILEFAQHAAERKGWSGDTLLLDGRPLRCHAAPLDGGMTLIRFALAPSLRPVVQKLTQRDPAIRVRGR